MARICTGNTGNSIKNHGVLLMAALVGVMFSPFSPALADGIQAAGGTLPFSVSGHPNIMMLDTSGLSISGAGFAVSGTAVFGSAVTGAGGSALDLSNGFKIGASSVFDARSMATVSALQSMPVCGPMQSMVKNSDTSFSCSTPVELLDSSGHLLGMAQLPSCPNDGKHSLMSTGTTLFCVSMAPTTPSCGSGSVLTSDGAGGFSCTNVVSSSINGRDIAPGNIASSGSGSFDGDMVVKGNLTVGTTGASPTNYIHVNGNETVDGSLSSASVTTNYLQVGSGLAVNATGFNAASGNVTGTLSVGSGRFSIDASGNVSSSGLITTNRLVSAMGGLSVANAPLDVHNGMATIGTSGVVRATGFELGCGSGCASTYASLTSTSGKSNLVVDLINGTPWGSLGAPAVSCSASEVLTYRSGTYSCTSVASGIGSVLTLTGGGDNYVQTQFGGKTYQVIGTYNGWDPNAVYLGGYYYGDGSGRSDTKSIVFGGNTGGSTAVADLVNKRFSVTGALTVSGASTLTGTVSTGALTSSSVTSTGTLSVTGGSTLSGAVTTGALTSSSVTSGSVTSSGAISGGSLASTGTLSVTGGSTLSGAVSTGALTSSSVTSGAISGSSLNVSGGSTLGTVNAGATAVSSLTVGGKSISAPLDCTGNNVLQFNAATNTYSCKDVSTITGSGGSTAVQAVRVNFNTGAGELYRTINFPTPFSATPIVTCSGSSNRPGNDWGNRALACMIVNVNSSQVEVKIASGDGWANLGQGEIDVIATLPTAAAAPVNGQCGSNFGTCGLGVTAINLNEHPMGFPPGCGIEHQTWSCPGLNNGDVADCSKDVDYGVCAGVDGGGP